MCSPFEEIAHLLHTLREEHNLTHAGMMPGLVEGTSVIWGLRYSEGGILYIIEGIFLRRVSRRGWETLTDFPPPWPWACDDLLDLQSSTHTSDAG